MWFVTIIAAITTITLNVLTLISRWRQDKLLDDINNEWEDFLKSKKKSKKEQITKIKENHLKQRKQIIKELRYVNEKMDFINQSIHDENKITSPRILKAMYNTLNLLQKTRDDMLAALQFIDCSTSDAERFLLLLKNDPELDISKLGRKLPDVAIRGELIIFEPDEKFNKEFCHEGNRYIIDDWRDKEALVRLAANNGTPVLIERFDQGTGLGHVSLAKGRLKENLDYGDDEFRGTCYDFDGIFYKVSFYSLNNIKMLRNGLLNLDVFPVVNRPKKHYIWANDRYYNHILAGEYPSPDKLNNSVLSLPIAISDKLQKKINLPFKKTSAINLTMENNSGHMYLANSPNLMLYSLSSSCITVDELVKKGKMEVNYDSMLSFTVVMERVNENDVPDYLIVSYLTFIEQCQEELRRQKLYGKKSSEYKRLMFYIDAFKKIRDKYAVLSSVAVTFVKPFMAEEDEIFLKEVKIVDLELALYKLDVKTGIKINYYRPGLAIKIQDLVLKVLKISGNTLILEPQLLEFRGLISSGHLFLHDIPVIRMQEEALQRLRSGKLVNPDLQKAVLFPKDCGKFELRDVKIPSERFNERQKHAIRSALSVQDLFLIQGPPGTGKTTVIVQIIKEELKRNPKSRILITSQSHVAVDNALEDIIADPKLRNISCRLGSNQAEEKLDPRIKCIYTRRNIPKEARIIGVTLGGIPGITYERLGIIDLSVIDEAGKASFTETLPGIICAKKLLLIGDHKQLPPMVEEIGSSDQTLIDEWKEIWEMSLFEQLFKTLPAANKVVLDTQYRMIKPIGKLVSDLFYEGQLKCGIGGRSTESSPILWIDLKKTRHHYLQTSLFNTDEALYIRDYVLNILLPRLPQMGIESIVVLSPYRQQTQILNQLFMPYSRRVNKHIAFCVATIDSFQGQQTDLVIYSAARTDGNIEFLQNERRLNVALSRTRKRFVLVGNSDALCGNKDSVNREDIFSVVYNYSGTKIEPAEYVPNPDSDYGKVLYNLINWENMMNRSILILTIGSHDVMAVEKNNGTLVKTKTKNLSDISDKPLMSCLEIPDKGYGKDEGKIVGICFPLFEKALHEIKRVYNKTPERIILIYTDRSVIKDKLASLQKHCLKKNHNKALKYINDIFTRIESDSSKRYASIITDYCADELSAKTIKLAKSTVATIGLGPENPDLNKIIDADTKSLKSEEELLLLLAGCDINREGFFYPCMFKAFLPLQNLYSDYNIFCALRGGIPLGAQCLNTVLDHLFPYANRIPLQIPEHMEGLTLDQSAGRYVKLLSLKKRLENAVAELDLENAHKLYQDFLLFVESDEISPIRIEMDSIMKRLQWSHCSNDFEHIYLRFLNAFYEKKFDQASVWLISLLEYVVTANIKEMKPQDLQIDENQYKIKILHGCGIKDEERALNLNSLFRFWQGWKSNPNLCNIHRLIYNNDKLRPEYYAILQNKLNIANVSYIKKRNIQTIEKDLIKYLRVQPQLLEEQSILIRNQDVASLAEMEDTLLGDESLLYELYKLSPHTSIKYHSELRRECVTLLDKLNMII